LQKTCFAETNSSLWQQRCSGTCHKNVRRTGARERKTQRYRIWNNSFNYKCYGTLRWVRHNTHRVVVKSFLDDYTTKLPTSMNPELGSLKDSKHESFVGHVKCRSPGFRPFEMRTVLKLSLRSRLKRIQRFGSLRWKKL
jgi:hypothetical protein